MGSRVLSSLCGLAIGLAAGGAAQAGPLISATWAGTLQGIAVTVTPGGATCTDVDPATVDAAGGQPVVPTDCPDEGLAPHGWSLEGAASFSVSLTMPTFSVRQFTTGGPIDLATYVVFGPGVQSIAGDASGVAVTMGIPGMVTVKSARHLAKGANISNLAAGATTLVQVPLSAGKAGTFTRFFYVLANPHYLTVDFYGWTAGSRVFTGLTSKGAALPTVVAMGGSTVVWSPTQPTRGVQTITLVAPSKLSIDGPLAQRRTASFSVLTLRYDFHRPLPEPGSLVLLAAGALLLGFGRRWSSH